MEKLLKSLLFFFGVCAVLAVIARLTFLKLWTVPEDVVLASSMAPNLAAGAIVVVLYRGDRGLGDLVRCPDPEDAQRWVVGRIAGTQGDQVEMAGPFLTLNGKRYASTEACVEPRLNVPHPTDGREVPHVCSRVEFAGGWHYIASAEHAPPAPQRQYRVGPGRVFLLSDNRSYHDDSRDFGAVMADTCKDRILFRLWGKTGFADANRRFTLIR